MFNLKKTMPFKFDFDGFSSPVNTQNVKLEEKLLNPKFLSIQALTKEWKTPIATFV
jgi:hypothetical protein